MLGSIKKSGKLSDRLYVQGEQTEGIKVTKGDNEWKLISSPVYEDGTVCISILHPPEDDKYGYEQASERWSPVQSPETILLSVISMLSSPNDESPANIDAAKLWREDPKEFRKRCRKCVRDSLGDD